jgi:hypothetical protein
MRQITITQTYAWPIKPPSLEDFELIARGQVPPGIWNMISSQIKVSGPKTWIAEAVFQELQTLTPEPAETVADAEVYAPLTSPTFDYKAAYELEKVAYARQCEKTAQLSELLASERHCTRQMNMVIANVRAELATAKQCIANWEASSAANMAELGRARADNTNLGEMANSWQKAMKSRRGSTLEHIEALEARIPKNVTDTWTADWKALRAAMTSRPRGKPMIEHVEYLETQHTRYMAWLNPGAEWLHGRVATPRPAHVASPGLARTMDVMLYREVRDKILAHVTQALEAIGVDGILTAKKIRQSVLKENGTSET